MSRKIRIYEFWRDKPRAIPKKRANRLDMVPKSGS